MDTPDKLWRLCKQCGNDFYIKKADIDFFMSKNLALPRRCHSCRMSNRTQAAPDEE